MTCPDKVPHIDAGFGLISIVRAIYSLRQNQHQYTPDYRHFTLMLDRYMEVLRDLQKQKEVANWIDDVREKWNWIDHLFSSNNSRSMSSESTRRNDERAIIVQPSYIEATSRQYEGNSAANSDSVDSDGALNYSEEDEDSRYDPAVSSPVSFDIVTATGAGLGDVNGAYNLHGSHDGVKKFRKISRIQGREEVFTLYRCKLSDGMKRWFISIVPVDIAPGTNKDVDFYSAPATGDIDEMPPTDRWFLQHHGRAPPPKLSFGDEDEILEQVDPTRPSDYC
jgi:hypothetical protein